MSANPIELVGGLANAANVPKADVIAWAKARVAQVLADAAELRNTALAGQLSVSLLTTGGFLYQDTADTTTADDGVNCIVSLDGRRFKPSTTPANQYETRAIAATAKIPATVLSIRIVRHTAGYPVAPSTYIPGTAAGPMAFQDGNANWWQLDVSGAVLLVPWFGAKGDGSHDDTTAVQAAVTASTGKRLDGMGLSYNITATIAGVDNIDFTGATLSQGAHPAAHPLINFADKTGWKLRQIWFKSSYPTTLDYSTSKMGAVSFSNSTANALSNMAIEDCVFSDFADTYWIYGLITGSGPINDFRFCRNLVLSSGLGSGANYQAQFHSFLNLFGSGASDSGIFINPLIEDNAGDFTDLGIGIALWSRNKGAKVLRNRIRNVGATSTFVSAGTNLNCYGIVVYDVVGSGGNITSCGLNGEIAHNYILNPPSSGIYFATAQGWDVHDNHVIGQFRTDDTSIPRAAISLNDCRKSIIHHNHIQNCWGGVAVVTVYGSDTVEVSDNHIYDNGASDSYGVRLGSSFGTASTATIAVKRNTMRLTGSASRAVRQLSDGSNKFGSILIEGNDIASSYQGLSLAGATFVGTLTCRGNKYAGVMANVALVASSIATPVVIAGELFDLTNATGVGINVDSSTAITVVDISFKNRGGAAVCFSGVGAKGTVDGIRFQNVAGSLRVAASSLGYAAPSYSGNSGDFVQDLSSNAYTQAGTAGSMYTNRGWVCDTGSTWRNCRTLTGN